MKELIHLLTIFPFGQTFTPTEKNSRLVCLLVIWLTEGQVKSMWETRVIFTDLEIIFPQFTEFLPGLFLTPENSGWELRVNIQLQLLGAILMKKLNQLMEMKNQI